MSISEETRRIKIKKFITFLKENKDEIAVQELDEILEEISEVQKQFVHKSEFRELIIEIREGFKRMEERFISIDKRFEDMNKRFEDINKRFEDINKRFEDINKRFEDINKRFEDINKNINFFKWFLSIYITILFGIMTLFFYQIKDQNQNTYNINLQILETLKEIKNEIKSQK
jgi:methyl-accepting chemotaxis protein